MVLRRLWRFRSWIKIRAARMGPTVWLELGPMPMEKMSKVERTAEVGCSCEGVRDVSGAVIDGSCRINDGCCLGFDNEKSEHFEVGKIGGGGGGAAEVG